MGLQTEPLMFFIDQAFNNPNGDVRNIAVKVTIEVYKLMGSPIEKYLKNVKPVVREVWKIIILNLINSKKFHIIMYHVLIFKLLILYILYAKYEL